MREKTRKVVFTFRTTTQAMKMERACRAGGLAGRMIPVPREISAGCGMAWCAPAGERERLEQMTVREGIDTEGIYERMLF